MEVVEIHCNDNKGTKVCTKNAQNSAIVLIKISNWQIFWFCKKELNFSIMHT